MAQEQKVVSLPEDAAKKLQCMNKEFFLFTPKNFLKPPQNKFQKQTSWH